MYSYLIISCFFLKHGVISRVELEIKECVSRVSLIILKKTPKNHPKSVAPLLQFWTTLKGHPSSRVPCEISRELCSDCTANIAVQLLPLPGSISLMPPECRSQEYSPMNFLHTHTHKRKI